MNLDTPGKELEEAAQNSKMDAISRDEKVGTAGPTTRPTCTTSAGRSGERGGVKECTDVGGGEEERAKPCG